MRSLLALLVLGACASAPMQTQAQGQTQPQTPPCTSAEFHQMDFWLGDWDARWEASPGQPAGSGRNHITREYGGCVIQEAFDGGPSTGGLIGHSVSTYHAPAQRWRQTWVDNQGGYFALSGGRDGDRFVLTSYTLAANKPIQRMVFEDIQSNSFTWRWQRTTDEGATWSDTWVIHYTRR